MFIGFIVVVGLGAFYALTYYLNHRIDIPQDCKDRTSSCEGCKIVSCGLHQTIIKEGK
ncbi:MAG: hypothetical protein WBO70_08485 [Erysipelotrichaceae bacterium]